MVRTGHGAIRAVQFDPPTAEIGSIEVLSLERMRVRGGADEFLTPQRLDFEMVIRIDAGAAVHTVDFFDHELNLGDVLWVRAGQVHQWGQIAEINGPAVLFTPHAIDDRTSEMVRAVGTSTPNHWPAAVIEGTPVAEVWDLLLASSQQPTGDRAELREAVLANALGALLAQLTLVRPAEARVGRAQPTRRTSGSVTRSNNGTPNGTRSPTTPNVSAIHRGLSTGWRERTRDCPPNSSSTSGSCSRQSACSATVMHLWLTSRKISGSMTRRTSRPTSSDTRACDPADSAVEPRFSVYFGFFSSSASSAMKTAPTATNTAPRLVFPVAKKAALVMKKMNATRVLDLIPWIHFAGCVSSPGTKALVRSLQDEFVVGSVRDVLRVVPKRGVG